MGRGVGVAPLELSQSLTVRCLVGGELQKVGGANGRGLTERVMGNCIKIQWTSQLKKNTMACYCVCVEDYISHTPLIEDILATPTLIEAMERGGPLRCAAPSPCRAH